MKELLEELGFEHLPMLSAFVDKISDGVFLDMLIDNEWKKTATPSESHKVACKIRMYQQFIVKPLTRGMFVPCDEESDILEEPDNTSDKYKLQTPDEVLFDAESFYEDVTKHLQAKERVIFEDFKIDSHGDRYFVDGETVHYVLNYKTIEQAINNGVKLVLK